MLIFLLGIVCNILILPPPQTHNSTDKRLQEHYTISNTWVTCHVQYNSPHSQKLYIKKTFSSCSPFTGGIKCNIGRFTQPEEKKRDKENKKKWMTALIIYL